MATVDIGSYTHTVNWTILDEDLAAGTFSVAATWAIHRNVSAGYGAFTGTAKSFGLGCTGASPTSASFSRTFDFRGYADWSPISGSTTLTTVHTFEGLTVNAAGDKAFTITIATPYVSSGFPAGNGAWAGSHHMDRNLLRVGVDDEWEVHEVHVGVNGAWVPAIPYAEVDDEWRLAVNA